jgi:hypothetical protein
MRTMRAMGRSYLLAKRVTSTPVTRICSCESAPVPLQTVATVFPGAGWDSMMDRESGCDAPKRVMACRTSLSWGRGRMPARHRSPARAPRPHSRPPGRGGARTPCCHLSTSVVASTVAGCACRPVGGVRCSRWALSSPSRRRRLTACSSAVCSAGAANRRAGVCSASDRGGRCGPRSGFTPRHTSNSLSMIPK